MSSIWKQKDFDAEAVNGLCSGTMAEWLGIRFTARTERTLEATMPVNERSRQPYGLLHGGASAALAETLGSVASALCIDPETQICVGMEINCNHLRGKKDGWVRGSAEPLHLGSTSHVWEIKIRDESGRLVCAGRLTVAVLKRRKTGES